MITPLVKCLIAVRAMAGFVLLTAFLSGKCRALLIEAVVIYEAAVAYETVVICEAAVIYEATVIYETAVIY